MKLFPILAMLVAHTYTSEKIMKMYLDLVEAIDHGDFSQMDLIHHLTSAGKAVFTQDCQDALYTIRQSLGGAGYSAWSNLPYLIDAFSPEVTYEGDNTVMAQQSFNYLRKQIKKVKTRGAIKEEGFFDYLNELKELTNLKCSGTDHTHFLSVENIHTALKVNLAYKVKQISLQIDTN